jgi:hypothetical protein
MVENIEETAAWLLNTQHQAPLMHSNYPIIRHMHIYIYHFVTFWPSTPLNSLFLILFQKLNVKRLMYKAKDNLTSLSSDQNTCNQDID